MTTNNPPPEAIAPFVSGLLRHGEAYVNDLGETHISLPERLPHVVDERSVTYICGGAERLHDIVIEHYDGKITDPIDAVEIVAQYQEDPIIDYSLPLHAGRVLLLPPPSYIQDVAYGDSLSEFPKIA